MFVMGFVLGVSAHHTGVPHPQTPKIAPLRGSSSPFPHWESSEPLMGIPHPQTHKISPLRGSSSPFRHWEPSERLTRVLLPQTPKIAALPITGVL